jgi:enoyl-CoA hydratase/carnithine racemase
MVDFNMTIQLEYDGGVATITLNRPEKRNAISFELIDDLLRALDEVAKSEAIVLIVTGAGKAFCSGNGSGEFEIAAGPFAGTEPAGFADDGPVVSLAV